MGRLYPRMRERPPEFRINYESPLWPGLQFALLGPAGSFVNACAIDMSPYRAVGIKVASWIWVPEVNRLAAWMPTRQNKMKFPNIYYLPQPGPKSLAVLAKATINAARYLSYQEGAETCGWELWAYNGYVTYELIGAKRLTLTELPCTPGDVYFLFATLTGNRGQLRVLGSRNYGQPTLASRTLTQDMKPGPNILYCGMRHETLTALSGWIIDALIWNTVLPDTVGYELADPSNVDLRVGGVPLILPPRRRYWPVVSEQALPKMVPWHLFQQVGA